MLRADHEPARAGLGPGAGRAELHPGQCGLHRGPRDRPAVPDRGGEFLLAAGARPGGHCDRQSTDVSSVLPPQLNPPKTPIVEITAKELGAVNSTGQYIPAPDGQRTLIQRFGLRLVNRQWRIDSLPAVTGKFSRELLLSKDFFQLAYQPRNLYYFDPSYKNLVPDPVFLPIRHGRPGHRPGQRAAGRAAGLAGGRRVLRVPSWQPARPGADPTGQQDRDRRPEHAQDGRDPVQPGGDVRAAGLDADQHVVRVAHHPGGEARGQRPGLDAAGQRQPGAGPHRLPAAMPAATAAREPYFLTASGAARVLTGHGTASAPVPGQAGTSQIPLTSIAISPDQHYLAGTGPSAGGTLYTADLAAAAPAAGQPVRPGPACPAGRAEGQRGQLGPSGRPVGGGHDPRPAGRADVPGQRWRAGHRDAAARHPAGHRAPGGPGRGAGRADRVHQGRPARAAGRHRAQRRTRSPWPAPASWARTWPTRRR